MVADATVNFMKFLTQHGLNVQEVSIAGFGVGAHIAGFIGAAFSQQKLAAIYGAISKVTHSLVVTTVSNFLANLTEF